MKNKKWIALAAAVVLAVTALPATAFAEKKDSTDDKMLTKITLNNCASHSRYSSDFSYELDAQIFYSKKEHMFTSGTICAKI